MKGGFKNVYCIHEKERRNYMNQMKWLRKTAACLLCCMTLSTSITFPVKAANETNLALNKPVTSTTIEGKNNASYANDGNVNTYWAAKNPSELEIDLEGYFKISKVNLLAYFDPSTGAVDRNYEYEIYGSVDQKNYTLLCENKKGDLEKPDGNDFEIQNITARYIKVKVLKTNAVNQPENNTAHIKELRVYGETDPTYEKPIEKTNVAKNKSAYSSGNESGHGAALAIDGNTNTFWSAVGEAYVEVDLEGYYDVDEINVLPYYSDGRFYHYEVYTSLDGLNYQKVGEKTNDNKQTAAGDTYTIDKQTIRYVKVNMTHNSANTSMHLCELRVMGVENTSYVPPVEPEDKDNVAAKKPARSYFNTTANPASAICDGDMKSRWQPSYYPGYVDIDLEENYDLKTIKIYPSYSDLSVYYQYSIYGSMDGATFYPIKEKQTKDTVTKEGDTFDISNIEARVIRVYLENVSKGNTGSINEVKVYGTQSDTAIEARPGIEVSDFEDTEYAKEINENEILDEVNGVVTRTIGAKYIDWFKFVIEDRVDAQHDYYEISNQDGKIQIKGNKGLSLTTGLNYYLKYYCNVSITQQARQVNMPATIVPVKETIYKETPYEVRYAYNFCTHSYTMAFWGETQWKNELDYLALNGFNAILDVTGAEEVYRRFLNELGYSNDEAKDWLVGPSYYGWQYMANMENVNGPIPDSWFADRTQLARENQRKMRALGMTPVLQGYSGMVPNSIQSKDSNAQIIAQGSWNGMQRPAMLKTTSSTFDDYAEIFYRVQKEVYGDVTDYYATDPFHEGGNTGGIGRDVVGRRVLDVMKKADNKAIWVIQSWSFQPALLQNITAEEKNENILLLDLNGTKGAKYSSTNEFASSDWVYCMLENYGGRSGIAGNLKKYTTIPSQIKGKTNHMTGIGIAPEGTNNNPVKYDLFLEMMWEDEDIDLDSWVEHYVERRYGADSEHAKNAWKLLLETSYMNTNGYADPPESIINARPQFDATKAAPNGNTNIHYNKQKFEKALSYLMEDYDALKDSEGYLYDVTDFLRQGIANSAQNEYVSFTSAYKSNDKTIFSESSKRFLDMIALQDQVLNSNKNFMVGTWLQASEEAAVGQDAFTQKIYSMNSKALITTWAPYYCWGVYDYANREYGGLTKDYYQKRWQTWIDRLSRNLGGEKVNTDYSTSEAQQLAWEWSRSDTKYPTEATGDLKQLYNTFKENYTLNEVHNNVVDQLSISAKSDLTEFDKDRALSKVLDGDASSFWSTGYGDQEPYDIYFTFDQAYTIHAFSQLPRAGGGNGNILGIELYVSDDGKDYRKIAEDTYANDATEKKTTFASVTTKYVKLRITDFLIYNGNQAIKSVTSAEMNFYKAEQGLSSNVYKIQNGKIAGVKEDTEVAQFIKQLNIPEGRNVVIERDGKTMESSVKVAAGDIVKMMNGDTVIEQYVIDALEVEADFTEINELIAAYEILAEADYTLDSWAVFAAELTIAIGVQVNPEATVSELKEACDALRKANAQLVSVKELKEAISKKAELKQEDYTLASWEAYISVYEDAKTLCAKSNATVKEIRDMVASLNQVMSALVTAGDTSALMEAILDGEDKVASGYDADHTTTSSWKAYKQAVDAAWLIMDHEHTAQREIDACRDTLRVAIEQLARRATPAIIQSLQAQIKKGWTLQSDVSEENYAALKTVLESAEAILANEDKNDIKAQDVQTAMITITKEIDKLQIPSMQQSLKVLIDQANIVLNSDLSDIRPANVQALKAAVKVAQQLLEEGCSDQQLLQNASLRITKCMQELYKIADKQMLIDFVASLDAANLQEENYTVASWNAYLNALQAANNMIQNDDASIKDVEQCYASIMQAVAELTKVVNKDALAYHIDIIKDMIDHIDAYVPSSVRGLRNLYEQAVAAYNNETITYAEVQALCEQLAKAEANARLYPDKHVLQEMLASVKRMNLALYTTDSQKELQSVVDACEQVLNNPEASAEEIEQVVQSLKSAVSQLVRTGSIPSMEENATSTRDTSTTISEHGTTNPVTTGDVTKLLTLCGLLFISGATAMKTRKKYHK